MVPIQTIGSILFLIVLSMHFLFKLMFFSWLNINLYVPMEMYQWTMADVVYYVSFMSVSEIKRIILLVLSDDTAKLIRDDILQGKLYIFHWRRRQSSYEHLLFSIYTELIGPQILCVRNVCFHIGWYNLLFLLGRHGYVRDSVTLTLIIFIICNLLISSVYEIVGIANVLLM